MGTLCTAGTDSRGVCRIEAKALRVSEPSTTGGFESALVTGFDAATNRFQVQWKSDGAECSIPRIRVLFAAENPFEFADRVAAAHRARRQGEANLRYSLYVDSMPTDELQILDTEQVNRILLQALNTKALKQNALDTSSLLNEVNLDFARTMNSIVFDTH